MRAPGGEEAAEAGPARFQCPEDFVARRFAPGAAFCPESLGAPGKRLLLISAPADFRPESLSGHRLTLPGSPLLKASQPDGSQKVYRLRASREESAARLLIAAARPERLTCGRPFGASLRIQETHGDPDAPRALFPVAERPPPRVPEGLKQRFFPFGARLKGPLPASEAAGKAARKRGKKRPLLPLKQAPWQPEGPEQLLGGSPEPAGGLLGGRVEAGSKQRPLKEEQTEAAAEPSILPVLGGGLLWQDARSIGHLEEAPEGEELDRRRGGKREKLETEELPDPTFRYWQPEQEPWLQGGRELEGGGGDCAGEPAACKAKKRKKRAEAVAGGLWGAAAIKEEPLDAPCLGSLLEEDPRAIGEDPVGEVPSCKKRRRKKKKERSRERLAEGLWGAAAIKEEPLDAPCLGSLPQEGLESPREEAGREFAGYIKQSPGKEAGGLWGVVALKEELGDVPSVGSLAEGSLGVTPEDPTGELPSCKKKKKKSREGGAEGLWSIAAVKEEPGDISCLGSLLEEGLGSARGGPAADLLACKKKKKKRGKLDKEPLREQETKTQLDWAAPLCQEPGLEEPLQTIWASPSPKKKEKRREGEEQAGLSAAGT